ncbi:MAG: flavodoxin domain-containing protein [Polaromonas sp.]
MKLNILVGTVTSTADYVAQAIQMDCADLTGEIEVLLMDGLDIGVFDQPGSKDALYIICTSTYGMGDLPDNAQALYDSLAAEPRFLGHVRYGVIALGDSASHSQTFCFGGKKFDERLQDLGARRLGEICCLDSGVEPQPEMQAVAWCRSWLAAAMEATATPSLPS